MSDGIVDDTGGRARRMLNEKAVLLILLVSHTTIWRMIKHGQFPKPTFISANRCIWFEDVILAWQNAIEGQDRDAAKAKDKPKDDDDGNPTD